MLEPFDEEWQYVGAERKATYTNLDPGAYTFRVKASNDDGLWNEVGTSLALTVKPYFWCCSGGVLLASCKQAPSVRSAPHPRSPRSIPPPSRASVPANGVQIDTLPD